jgi:hypothetical protein
MDHHNIAIPLHINGNHWAALCRRKINGEVYFLYADDLNMDRTERQVKSALATIPDFMPTNAVWMNCVNNTYLPHSNECGPRTILSLAVFMSDPTPSTIMLQHYMNGNLAMQARTWMGQLLLTGQSPLLPPNADTTSIRSRTAISRPFDLLDWNNSHSANLGENLKPAEAQSPDVYNTKVDRNLSDSSSIADPGPLGINNVPPAQIKTNTTAQVDSPPIPDKSVRAPGATKESVRTQPGKVKASL